MEEKIFTFEGASKTLTHLKRLLKQAQVTLEQLTSLQEEIQAAYDQAKNNGGSPAGPEYVKSILQLEQISRSIDKKGVLVKDLQRGLCDFPYELDGRIVYLCWELGEDEIQWWHETTDGYAGRKRLAREKKGAKKENKK